MSHEIVNRLKELGAQRVVIHGYRDPDHTHHWIQRAFFRAFESVLADTDIPVVWLANSDRPSVNEFQRALIIGNVNLDGVDWTLPLHGHAYYLIHNHNPVKLKGSKFRSLVDQGRALFFDVFRGRTYGSDYRQVAGEPLHFFNRSQGTVVITWGTDLLPHEINQNIDLVSQSIQTERAVRFVGSIWRRNIREMRDLAVACAERQIPFEQFGSYVVPEFANDCGTWTRLNLRSVSIDENQSLVRSALVAPAIQGVSQMPNTVQIGNYVPCRIFKNISYGAPAVTNNYTANELYGGELVYETEIGRLIDLAVERRPVPAEHQRLISQMEQTRDEHTYLNRILTLLRCLTERAEQFNPTRIHLSTAVSIDSWQSLQNHARRWTYFPVSKTLPYRILVQGYRKLAARKMN